MENSVAWLTYSTVLSITLLLGMHEVSYDGFSYFQEQIQEKGLSAGSASMENLSVSALSWYHNNAHVKDLP